MYPVSPLADGTSTPLSAPFLIGVLAAAVAVPAIMIVWMYARKDDVYRREWRARRGLGLRGRYDVTVAFSRGRAVSDPRYAPAAVASCDVQLRLLSGRRNTVIRIIVLVFGVGWFVLGVLALLGPDGEFRWTLWGWVLVALFWLLILHPSRIRKIQRCRDRNAELAAAAPLEDTGGAE